MDQQSHQGEVYPTSAPAAENSSSSSSSSNKKKRRHPDSTIFAASSNIGSNNDNGDDEDMTSSSSAAAAAAAANYHNHDHLSNAFNKTSQEMLELIEYPNFEELARQYPTFQKAWNETRRMQKESNKNINNNKKSEKKIDYYYYNYNNNNNKKNNNKMIHSKNKGSFSSCVTQEFTVTLTRAILQMYFHLQLPRYHSDSSSSSALSSSLIQQQQQQQDDHLYEHLCPPVPNRFFYLHWIDTELLLRNNQYQQQQQQQQQIIGLDIGVGATCIYPLLGSKFFHYNMFGTDIDKQSLMVAKTNIITNQLQNYIHLVHVPPSYSQQMQQQQQQIQPNNVAIEKEIGGPLQRSMKSIMEDPQSLQFMLQKQQQQNQQLGATNSNNHESDSSDIIRIDFVMTNPPFYDEVQEFNSEGYSNNRRHGDGRVRTVMTTSEGTYPLGEVGFVTEMIADSLRGFTSFSSGSKRSISCKWYSSMLGKKSSFVQLQKLLIRILGPGHVKFTEYGPGQYTRWFLAWTLQQPSIDTSMARLPIHEKDTFHVPISNTITDNNATMDTSTTDGPSSSAVAAMYEVVERIKTYCNSSPGGWDLTTKTKTTATTTTTTSTTMRSGGICNNNGVVNHNDINGIIVEITESMPLAITHFVDESTRSNSENNDNDNAIPDIIMDALRYRKDNTDFLPNGCHHFLIQIMVVHVGKMKPTNTKEEEEEDDKKNSISVTLQCYRHSTRGCKAIEKIRHTIQGEVCRTNRKWRRKQKQQQQQQQNHQVQTRNNTSATKGDDDNDDMILS